METKVTKINALPKFEKQLNVCAYARVSSGKDAMLHSLSSQVSFYNKMIQQNPKWKFVGVYSDEAISGTKTKERAGFQEMLKDCREGKIDLIITKSISRFARNTVTMLEVVRELKKLNVDVFFEEQNVHTLSKDGELILTFLASFAQEEARSMSENVRWRIKKLFEEGKPASKTILGYRLVDGNLAVVPDEAKKIKKIFELYLSGLGLDAIVKKMNSLNYKTRHNLDFNHNSIYYILRNKDYTGDLYLQKTYRHDYLSKVDKWNKGERPMYLVENNHEAIIDKETFNKVQEEIARRKEQHPNSTKSGTYEFSLMVRCERCKRFYIRKKNHSKYIWRCSNYDDGACRNPAIQEVVLKEKVCKILNLEQFDEAEMRKKIDCIGVDDTKILIFYLKDNRIIKEPWEVPSRKNSWTPEMKEQARQRSLKQLGKEERNNGKSNDNSIDN